ncbi:MAG: WGR domain-containing protein [Hyphomicrobiales bacterium]
MAPLFRPLAPTALSVSGSIEKGGSPISKRSRPAGCRFYAICVTPTLFSQWAGREWGRIGQGGAVRENWLESESEASAAGTKLRRQKERHGYRAF